jgi:hypothetical protein
VAVEEIDTCDGEDNAFEATRVFETLGFDALSIVFSKNRPAR